MDQFADLTGRRYRIFEYEGAPDATRVIIAMGSGSQTASETAKVLNRQGRRVGVLTIRLFRPFSVANFVHACPRQSSESLCWIGQRNPVQLVIRSTRMW